jgi:predicted RNA methylase
MRRSPRTRSRGCAPVLLVLLLLVACGDPPAPPARDPASLAPYVASPENIVEEMLRLAEVGPEDVLYDLGSGDGRIVIMAAREHGARGIGFELDADLVRQSAETATRAGVAHRVEFRRQDVLTVDLSPATVVTIYIGQEGNRKLRPAVQNQLRQGARVVSLDFDMGDWRPDAVRQLLDEAGMTHTLFLWRIRRP